MKHLSFVVAAAALALVAAAPASASGLSPCGSRVINDWYNNGKIDHSYAISCYRDALDNLPEDVEDYANARDVITAAMRAQLAANAKAQSSTTNPGTETTTGGGPTPTEPTFTDTTGIETKPVDTNPTETTTETETDAGPVPGSPDDPPVKSAFQAVEPSDASSIPVPLIVLGVLGLLLLAAGAAGVVARKLQERRTPATPGGSPPADTPPTA